MKKQRSISAKKARAAAHKMRKPRATSKPARKKSAAAARSKSLPPPKGLWVSRDKMDRVLDRLREAQETLNAIRSGDVDAVVVTGSKGNHVYTLTSAEQPYRVFVEHMQEGALTVSAGGIILYCNKRFAEMANLPLERVISAKISDFITIQAWDVLAEVFNKSGRSVKCEDVLQSRGRRILSVTYTASLIPMDEQKVMCLVVTDLTQQREHENLRLAKDLAEKASLAKDSFLATLSHELRTPLTPALITSISLEENEELPESLRQDVSMIRRNIELEARLIDDLLDLTRISHGKFEIALAPMDVHAVLNRVIEICRSTIDAKRQRLQVEFGAKNPLTMGDGIRLQQVFWNIIRNAVKFTPQEGTITIATSNTEKEIRIAIADTGIGFEAESAPKLFHAFEQAGRDITRRFGGLGLGLAISRSIVDAHGGRITATSEGIQRGATFTVSLPLREVRHSSAMQKNQNPAGPAARKLGILLVEDHTDTRLTMQRLLERLNHRVTPAGSAGEALELAADGGFDIVISDLGLPDMTGIELMRQLRDRHHLTGIAVSGYGMEEDLRKSRLAGFEHHLTKPINFGELRDLIAQIATTPVA